MKYVPTGFPTIDATCFGVKPGELWVHTGHVGDLKTSFVLNWAYNAVTQSHTHVLFVSVSTWRPRILQSLLNIHWQTAFEAVDYATSVSGETVNHFLSTGGSRSSRKWRRFLTSRLKFNAVATSASSSSTTVTCFVLSSPTN